MPTWIIDTLLPEVEKSVSIAILTNLLALLIACALYYYRRRVDKQWVRANGMLLYVYFRNVDNRCKTIQELSSENTLNLHRIAIEVIKLQADLAAMQTLVSTWDRRLRYVRAWFKYARDFNQLLDSFDALSISLTRHLYPLQAMLGMVNEKIVTENDLRNEIGNHLAFFVGGDNRIFGKNPRSAEAIPGKTWMFHEIIAIEDQKLYPLLKCFLENLIKTMRSVHSLDLQTVLTWDVNEKPGVWFQNKSGN